MLKLSNIHYTILPTLCHNYCVIFNSNVRTSAAPEKVCKSVMLFKTHANSCKVLLNYYYYFITTDYPCEGLKAHPRSVFVVEIGRNHRLGY